MATLPGEILVFHQLRLSTEHQLRLSTEHHTRVSIIAPGWGSVNLSQFTHHPLELGYSYREERGGSLTTTE